MAQTAQQFTPLALSMTIEQSNNKDWRLTSGCGTKREFNKEIREREGDLLKSSLVTLHMLSVLSEQLQRLSCFCFKQLSLGWFVLQQNMKARVFMRVNQFVKHLTQCLAQSMESIM